MLEGPRVLLRKLTDDDPLAAEWIATDMANCHLAHSNISSYYENYPQGGTGWLGIADQLTGEVLGRAGLLPRSDVFQPAELEIAYVIAPNHRQMGYGGEVAALLLNLVKHNPAIHRAFTGIALDNIASLRIAESIGLTREYIRSHYNVPHAYYWYRKPGDYTPEQFADQ